MYSTYAFIWGESVTGGGCGQLFVFAVFQTHLQKDETNSRLRLANGWVGDYQPRVEEGEEKHNKFQLVPETTLSRKERLREE